MPSRLATSLTVKLCGGNSFFNTASFLSGEYRVTHSSLALCSINDDLMRVTTSLTQGDGVQGLSKSLPGPVPSMTPDQRRIAQLEKDNARLSRKLDIANDCLDLQKKAFTIFDHLKNGNEQ